MIIQLPDQNILEAIDWLWANVGTGNYNAMSRQFIEPNSDDDWHYSRVYFRPVQISRSFVTINDEQKANWFVLRWSS